MSVIRTLSLSPQPGCRSTATARVRQIGTAVGVAAPETTAWTTLHGGDASFDLHVVSISESIVDDVASLDTLVRALGDGPGEAWPFTGTGRLHLALELPGADPMPAESRSGRAALVTVWRRSPDLFEQLDELVAQCRSLGLGARCSVPLIDGVETDQVMACFVAADLDHLGVALRAMGADERFLEHRHRMSRHRAGTSLLHEVPLVSTTGHV